MSLMIVKASAPDSPKRVPKVWRNECSTNSAGNFSKARTRACCWSSSASDSGPPLACLNTWPLSHGPQDLRTDCASEQANARNPLDGFVELYRAWLLSTLSFDGVAESRRKIPKSGDRLSIANADLSLREGGSVSSLDLARHSGIALLRALLNMFGVENEVVPRTPPVDAIRPNPIS